MPRALALELAHELEEGVIVRADGIVGQLVIHRLEDDVALAKAQPVVRAQAQQDPLASVDVKAQEAGLTRPQVCDGAIGQKLAQHRHKPAARPHDSQNGRVARDFFQDRARLRLVRQARQRLDRAEAVQVAAGM